MSDLTSPIVRWAKEAKRRRIWVPVGAYAVIALTIIEFSDAVFEALLLPEWSSRLVTVFLILGFPLVITLSWIFDVTSEGIRVTEATGADDEDAGTPSARVRPAHGSAGAPRGGKPKVRRISLDAPGAAAGTATPPRAKSGSAEVADASEQAPAEPPDPERVKQATLGHVRHELKTPINAVLGYSEMLLEDLEDDDDEIAEDLEKIRSGGRQLLSLVDQILSPSRIQSEAAAMDLDEAVARIRIGLRTPVTSVVGYAELLIETAGETGREHMVPDLERIRDAARRLLDLSSDILQVATDHIEEMGDDRLAKASEITAGVLTKARRGGHQASEHGMGSLLVVDDNAMNRDLLSRQLARAGYAVQTAEGGKHALDLMEQRSYDLVLLDVIMPEMDGLDVLRTVKSDDRLAETPVIMLSSLDDLESAISCIDLGAEDFLSKPFHPTLLQARIGATLDVRRMRKRMEAERARVDATEHFVERMLRGVFPASITERIRQGESAIVESYGDATVLWCDVDAAARRQTRDPAEVAHRLQRLLTTLEAVTDEHDLEALAQAGDGVVVAGGVPNPTPDHADRVAEAAVDLRDALDADDDLDAPVRLGLDSGEVTGGVLGGERLAYRMWGDPVDLARALGAGGPAGRVMVSPGAYRLLKDRWRFATPGVQEVPGHGQMKTYVLEGPA